MLASIPYEKPLNPILTNLSVDHWYRAIDSYDHEQYRESLSHLFLYLGHHDKLPSHGKPAVSIPHGSIMLHFNLDDSHYRIEAPFLKVPEGPSRVALLRQLAELNYSFLKLSNINLRDDSLYFEYEDRIENCEPYKMYHLFEEICSCADYYDDFFIEKFGTTRIQEPHLHFFDHTKKDEAYAIYHRILSGALNNCEYFEQRRGFALAMDILATAIRQVFYCIAPQGQLGNEFIEALSVFQEHKPLEDLIARAKDRVRKLLTVDRTKFDNAMFYPKFFIPLLKTIDLPNIHSFLEENFEELSDAYQARNYTAATILSLSAIYRLYWTYSVPSNVRHILDTALKKAGGEAWDKAADLLYKALCAIMAMKNGKQSH